MWHLVYFFKDTFQQNEIDSKHTWSDPDEPAAEHSDKENNDDESIIDKVVSQEVESDSDGGDAPTPSANRSRKFLDSSDDESDADAEATLSRDKEKKRVKKSFLDSRSGH